MCEPTVTITCSVIKPAYYPPLSWGRASLPHDRARQVLNYEFHKFNEKFSTTDFTDFTNYRFQMNS